MTSTIWIGFGRAQRTACLKRGGAKHMLGTLGMLVLILLTIGSQVSSSYPGGVLIPNNSSVSPVKGRSPNASALEVTSGGTKQPVFADDWWLVQIGAPAAWEKATGSVRAVVAVVDAGIDRCHPDLAGQLWENPGEIADNGLDDDNNGHIDDIHGWNMVDDNADLSDSTGHGTAMAGIIAAARNDHGLTGVCPVCQLMVVKVTRPDGQARYTDIAAGIAYAAQNGADVINLSLRGHVNSATLWRAVTTASQKAVVVSGAGNDGSATRVYPGAYDHVLAVAATGRDGVKLGSSNHGAWVDVVAPGSEIRTSRSGGGYWQRSGTSVAAAVTSGLAGLLYCQHPDWSPADIRAQIVQTADCVDESNPGYEHQLGSGRVNASQAIFDGKLHRMDGPADGRSPVAR